ncbi:uncharacterized protein [Dermacentor albipictus]|uniref:uncharacterized protein isoform X1 n=1 Tax=Dermacentor albipictus TaxID=60249 RepID=UPI0038FC60E3
MYSPEEPTTRAAAAAGSGNRQHGHCSAVAWPDYRFEALRCRPRVQPARHAAASVDDDELPHGRVQQRRGGNAKQLPSEATHEFFSSSVPARQCGSTTAFQHQGPPIGNASTLLESGNDFAYLSPVILPTARQHMRTFVHVHNVHDCAAARSCTALVAKDIKPGPAASLFSGHGGTTRKATMGLRTLFFIVQVSRFPKLPHASFKSDDLFLVVLPCPKALVDPFHSLLLFLCGDVESNPGPSAGSQKAQSSNAVEEILKTLKDLDERSIRMETLQKSMATSISDLKEKQESVCQVISDIKARLEKVEQQTFAIEQKQTDLDDVRDSVVRVEKHTRTLHSRLNDAEDRARRNNLLFYDLPDSADETYSKSEEKILKIFADTLKVDISTNNIARAHRIGRFATGKARPLIVKFETYKCKDLVLSKRQVLKDEKKISVSEDYCPATRHCRKKLIEFGKNTKKSFKLHYNKLIISGKTYVYNEAHNTVTEIEAFDSTQNDLSPRTLRSGREFPLK